MNIVFLDFDGPLFTDYAVEKLPEELIVLNGHRTFVPYYYTMNKDCVANINKLAKETGCKFVISSTWRHFGERFVRKLLKINNVNIELHKDWRTAYCYSARVTEIEDWMDRHIKRRNKFLIIDDNESGWGLEQYKKIPVILVSLEKGFTESNLKTAIDVFNKEK